MDQGAPGSVLRGEPTLRSARPSRDRQKQPVQAMVTKLLGPLGLSLFPIVSFQLCMLFVYGVQARVRTSKVLVVCSYVHHCFLKNEVTIKQTCVASRF